jgi:hypothetical protein
MELFIIRNRSGVNALCTYDENEKTFTVKAGSIVSNDISNSRSFNSTESIKKQRKVSVKGRQVISDVVFTSSSTAANFVTGTSTNGLVTWKNKDGITLKEILEGEHRDEHN